MALGCRIEGKGIFLNPLDPNMLSPAYSAWMKDRDVLQYLTDPGADYGPEQLRAFVEKMNASAQDYLFGVFLNSDGRHIGNVKLGGINSKHKFADIGIIIGDKHLWGQGIATETIILIRNYAFDILGLNKVYAGMLEGNTGSYKAFRKAGFYDVGRYRRHWLVNAQYQDSLIVECLNDRGSLNEES